MLTRGIVIAAVMGNWHNVLRAINMASSEFLRPLGWARTMANIREAKLAKPPGQDEREDGSTDSEANALPQTLVRIPTEHAPVVHAQVEAAEAEGDTVMSI